ncbi:helix-turn-helix domain-containing protein [Microcoleus sp. CAWBG58]|uniref:helix-turn-helix domain-containing protein n=1 Tax=Microcoleus sp. CAWBG58 TaxID=2841651 RepID=UPI0025DA7B45|nr:AraC family transcriptional regulator [Microcoleus sp. CAWBG58]
MQHHQPSIARSPREYVSLFPRPPHLTSFTTQWQGISVITMQQSPYELPEVCIPLDGVGIFTSSNLSERSIDGISKSESTNVGDIVVVPANIGHSVRWFTEGEMIVIGLDTSLVARAIDDAAYFTQTELLPHFSTPDPLVYQLGLSLKSVLEQDPAGSRLYAETAAAMLSVHLLQKYGKRKLEFKDYTDGLPRSILRQVIEYIEANLGGELGLADLAAIANLSPHYFTRLFKQSTGFTPHQFVIRCRVERAKILLLAGKESIAEIAQQVGFANQAHLSVHIKRLLGITPKMILEHRKNL